MMSDLNHRLDKEIRKGKYVEEALKRNADISSPFHEEEPPAPLEEETDTENASERPVKSIQSKGSEPQGEQKQPETAVTDTAADDLQSTQQRDNERGSVNTSDMDQTGGEPPASGSDKQ